MSRDHAALSRCLAVWTAVSLLAGLLLSWLLPVLGQAVTAPPPAARFEEWLVAGCSAAATVSTGWLWLLVSLVTLEAAGRARRPHRGVPVAVRRVVLAACGAGLAGGLLAPAYAASPPSLDGLPLPDRPTVATAGVTRPDVRPEPLADVRAAAATSVRTVRVVRGDTLWSLAVADLPEGASDAEVAEHCREIHAANRELIGPDPDLIRPGQQLRLPPKPSPPST